MAFGTWFPMRVVNPRGISVGSRQDAPAIRGAAGHRMIEMKPVTCREGIQSIKPAPCDVAGANLIVCQTMKKLMLILAVAAFAFSPLMVSSAEAGQGKHAHGKHHAKHHHGKHHPKS